MPSKLNATIATVAALIGVASAIGAYAVLPGRVEKVEKRQDTADATLVRIEIAVGRVEEQNKAILRFIDMIAPPIRVGQPPPFPPPRPQ